MNTTTTFGFELKKGQLAPEGVKFMTFKTATKYPYMFIGHGNRQKVILRPIHKSSHAQHWLIHKVAENFFDKNQIYGHTYDL